MNVYWVESFDHCEDWFVAARDAEQAVQYFANYLGYDIIDDDVQTTLVCEQQKLLSIPDPHFLDNREVISCGGEFIDFHDQDILAHVSQESAHLIAGETRIVRIGGKVFMEGNVLRVALQMEGKLPKT